MRQRGRLLRIAPSTALPPQALRADVLDLIAVLCCIYCFLMCFMHLGLSIFPYLHRFFGFINPFFTAAVFAICGTVHIRGWWRMRAKRCIVNRTTQHLSNISPLLAAAQSRHQVNSGHSNERILHLVRLQSNSLNPSTDLAVVHEQLQQTKREYEGQGARGSATIAMLSAKAEWIHVQMMVERLYQEYFGPRGAFSQQGMHYEVRLLVRECIVLPMQFLRGYNVSNLVSSPLTMTYGLVLGLHCLVVAPCLVWNFSSLQRHFSLVLVYRERLVVVMILFDLVLGVVLPLSLAVPVIYNLVTDPTIIHDQDWDVYAISVIKAMLIMTATDLVSAVMPMLLLYVTLQNVHASNIDSFFMSHATAASASSSASLADVIHRRTRAALGWFQEKRSLRTLPSPVRGSTDATRTKPPAVHEASVIPAHSVEPEFTVEAPERPVDVPTSSPLVGPLAPSLIRWRYGVFVLFMLCSMGSGVVIAKIAVRSFSSSCSDSSAPAYTTCSRYVRPWHVFPLSDQVCHCQVLKVDCTSMAGTTDWSAVFDDMASFLESQVPTFVNFLRFHSCPMHTEAKKLPLARFTELYFLLFLDCHLESSDIASMEFSQYSRMLFLSFTNNSISDIPETLRWLPPLCLGVSFTENNLYHATFPDWIVPAWENLTMLYFRHSNMSAFPPVFLHLEWIGVFDMTGNAIATFPPLPTTWGFWSRLTELRLASNRLTSVPSKLTALPALQVLTLASNKLAECPVPSRPMTVYTTQDNPCCVNQPVLCGPMCHPVCDEVYRIHVDCLEECTVPACLDVPGSTCQLRPPE